MSKTGPAPAAPRKTPLAAFSIFLAATVVFQALTLECSNSSSVTVDEFAHVPAGVAIWELGSFYLYRENPPLVRAMLALPVWLSGAKTNYASARGGLGRRLEWQVGNDFMHANAGDYMRLFQSARFVNVALSTACGLVIFLWSYELAGGMAAVVGSLLWYADPNVIAHSSLATTDIGSTAFGFAATYVYWKTLRYPTRGMVLASGIALGLALSAKFSMLSLCPAWLILAVLIPPAARGEDEGGSTRGPGRRALNFLAVMFASLVVLNLVYLFEGTFTRLGSYSFASRALSDASPDEPSEIGGNRFRGTALSPLPVPLPKDYVLGLDSQKREEGIGFANIVDGRLIANARAPWYGSFAVLAQKLPEGTVLLLAAAATFSVVGRRFDRAGAMLLVPALCHLALICSQTKMNWIFRYNIQILPYLFVLAACFAGTVLRTRGGRCFVLACLAMDAASLGSIRPFYLTCGNTLAGGQAGAQGCFLGSNFDWGQDLIRLKLWSETHGVGKPLAVSFYGPQDPATIGLATRGLPSEFHRGTSNDAGYAPSRGPDVDNPRGFYWAISSNFLHGFSGPMHIDPDGKDSIAIIDSKILTPDRAVARVGSIFVFDIAKS